ncbi:ligase-associated DNA damage response exonuclease [Verticiella sediminum]|uniref:Ligase-associated DNA damage response exonuclease n=1 Tax=Verticiella sediminum TaxID=1247510 RepID=A0A556AS69_9BURK|nr:ligase-associated DNA damage response exonuclease [Verticiella sediminum]TSH95789.1 ligase-associated DNA damage response exonuclease [Verticiella sediminum]
MDLIVARPEGLYCPSGDFHIDPWRPVPRAVITHAHSDHARGGHGSYLATQESAGLLRARLGADIALQTVAYGEHLRLGEATVSLHPAGHVLGSAQVRVEHRGEVWVASGDYKTEADGTCAPFEPVPCHTFITESTFGLPVYRWLPQAMLMAQIQAWWEANAAEGRASVLYSYALGKAQRILHHLTDAPGPILVHGAVDTVDGIYREAGVRLPPTRLATEAGADVRRALVVAPPSARGSSWTRRFGEHADAFASGWMQVRGARRRRGVDRGFIVSDHADWDGLCSAVAATGAECVYLTHGSTAVMQRWFAEQGLDARTFHTEYGDEEDEASAPAARAP